MSSVSRESKAALRPSCAIIKREQVLRSSALRYPTLSLEQIHATIIFYLAYHEQVDDDLQRVEQQQESAYQQAQHATDLQHRAEVLAAAHGITE